MSDATINKDSAVRRAVRSAYAAIAAAYLVCVVIQVFLAGMGTFVDSGDWQLHRAFANSFEFASPILFLLSFFGHIRGAARWLPLGLFALTSLQHLTIREFEGWLPALHTVDALLLFWIALNLTKRSARWLPGRARANAKAKEPIGHAGE